MRLSDFTQPQFEGSLIALELPLSPVGIFALGIEHPLDMTVQRLHNADARHHRGAATHDDQEEVGDTEPSLGSFDRMIDQVKAWRTQSSCLSRGQRRAG